MFIVIWLVEMNRFWSWSLVDKSIQKKCSYLIDPNQDIFNFWRWIFCCFPTEIVVCLRIFFFNTILSSKESFDIILFESSPLLASFTKQENNPLDLFKQRSFFLNFSNRKYFHLIFFFCLTTLVVCFMFETTETFRFKPLFIRLRS